MTTPGISSPAAAPHGRSWILAAAQAESGLWEEAAATAALAAATAEATGDKAAVAAIRARAQGYADRRPYRSGPARYNRPGDPGGT